MQFKISVVKYSKRDIYLNPSGPLLGLWPGRAGPPAVAAVVAVLCSCCPSRGSLSLAQSCHPQPTLEGFQLFSCFLMF